MNNHPSFIKVGVVGSRRRDTLDDKMIVINALHVIMEEYPDKEIMLVSGGCKDGADHFAEEIAKDLGLSILIHYPRKWKLPEHPNKWNFAQINYERNQYIANDCDFLIALPAEDRTGGTEDTIRRTKKLKKEIILK